MKENKKRERKRKRELLLITRGTDERLSRAFVTVALWTRRKAAGSDHSGAARRKQRKHGLYAESRPFIDSRAAERAAGRRDSWRTTER